MHLLVSSISLDDLAIVFKHDTWLREALALQFQHGGTSGCHDCITVLDDQRWFFWLAVQFMNRALSVIIYIIVYIFTTSIYANIYIIKALATKREGEPFIDVTMAEDYIRIYIYITHRYMYIKTRHS